jgi:hypothetical protein
MGLQNRGTMKKEEKLINVAGLVYTLRDLQEYFYEHFVRETKK